MWRDEWINSKCTQDLQKVRTKLPFLPDNAKKNSIFSPSAKIKICTLSKAQSNHIIHTHTHTHTQNSKNITYAGTTSIPGYRPMSQNVS